MPFPMSNPQPDARPRNSLAETPAASCSSHADGRPGTKPLASRPRPGIKASLNAAPAPCRPNSLQPPESYSADTPAGPLRRSPPAPQGGGAHVPGRAAPRFHAPASRARAGHRSAALGGGARWGLSAPAAHRAPSSSSPGPSLRAHTHLTSARIKTRGAAPDGGPRRSRARPECRRAARTARASERSTFLSLQRMLQTGVGKEKEEGEGNRLRGQDLPPNSGAALAPSQPPAELTALAASAH